MSVPSTLPTSGQQTPFHGPHITPADTVALGATSAPVAGATNEPLRGCGHEWLSLLDACEKLTRAGLRRQIGPDGDLKDAYRRWYREQMDEHDRLVSASYDRLHAAFAEPSDAA